MDYAVSFGRLDAGRRAAPGPSFRIAVLGDFSGRAARGVVEGGAKLASRKALRVDVDNLDDVLARLAPVITVGLGDEGAIEVPIACMDDFHPDQLVEALPLFEALLQLRRDLSSRAGFERAAKEVLGWAGTEPLAAEMRRGRGGAVAVDRRLSDFARLTGRPAAAAASVDELVRRLVGPFIVPARDSRQEALVARVDAALSEAMRRVLHSPEFQSAEALWRGLEMLVRRLETGARLQVVVYDVSAEELAADLASQEDLVETALYSLLVEQPGLDEQAGAFSFIAGLYGFALTPPHADLLGRLAQLAGAAGAPAVVAMGADALRVPEHEWHPMVRQAWGALRESAAAAYLGVVTPRFLLRMPYGKRTDPIDAFGFEEFTRQGGLSGMLWGNPAVLLALLAGQSWLKAGGKMALGAVSVVGDLAVYVMQDSDGDQVALPCTERLLTERAAAQVSSVGVIPVVSLRGRPEVRVAGFGSVAGGTLAGRWAPVEIKPVVRAAVVAPVPVAVVVPVVVEPVAVPEVVAEVVSAEPVVEDDLEALLASLAAEPAPVAADETEADLDALLASLK